MSDWRRWCRGAEDLKVQGESVEVSLPDGRHHRVTIEETSGGLCLSGRVATRGALGRVDRPEVFVWTRNRSVNLVGFSIARNDGLIGESWVPAAGLEPDEFLLYLRVVAAECDRLEMVLTGEDVE